MDMRIPPLRIKISLESNPLKSRIVVGRLAVRPHRNYKARVSQALAKPCVKVSDISGRRHRHVGDALHAILGNGVEADVSPRLTRRHAPEPCRPRCAAKHVDLHVYIASPKLLCPTLAGERVRTRLLLADEMPCFEAKSSSSLPPWTMFRNMQISWSPCFFASASSFGAATWHAPVRG